MDNKKCKLLMIGVLVLGLCFGSYYTSSTAETITGITEETGTFKVLIYNVAGLPELISGGNPKENTRTIGTLLNDYDLVGVQEDFHYHDDLMDTANTFPYVTKTKGTVPIGDGINVLSKFPMLRETRISWRKTSGFFSNGSDELTPKGLMFQRIQVKPGVYVDIYNIHCDAGRDSGSTEARHDNFKQVAEMINTYSVGNAVIVMGDTNSRYFREEDRIYELLIQPTGLKDAWVEVVRDGDFPEPDAEKLAYIEAHVNDPGTDKDGPDHEEVDKILYRSGQGIDLEAIVFKVQDETFIDSQGDKLSDHYAFTATFQYRTHTPTKNKVYLSDMRPLTFTNGWGPVEFDTSNGEKGPRDGRGLTIEGSSYSKGLGVHGNSTLSYPLNKNYSRLKTYIGMDDEKSGGSVVFKVVGDGMELYKSQVVHSNTPPIYVDIDVSHVSILELIVTDAGNGNEDDHADWADAYLIRHEEQEEAFRVNDTDGGITYKGHFSYETGRNSDYKNDIHQTTRKGDSFAYTFYGTGIAYMGVKDGDILDQKVTIDGVSMGSYQGYLPSYTSRMTLFEVRDLPLGYHTITVEMLSGGWMVLDGFKVYRPIPDVVYLSDISWDYASNGYGPIEYNKSNGEDHYNDGRTLTLNGTRYNKGLGVHSYSEIRYSLGRKYQRFQSYIGIDDEVNGGSAKFQVYGDGLLLYESGTMHSDTGTAWVDLNISHVGELTLKVQDEGNNKRDHADWADAKLLK